MLGRLQMDISSCIEVYSALSDEVFRKVAHRINIKGHVQARFDATVLERFVKMVVLQQGNDQDALMLEKPAPKCKVVVCATRGENRATTHLSSYSASRSANDPSITIWEAARATSAASSYFDPIVIGKHQEQYLDGATGANNPVRELWTAAQDLWDDENLEEKIRCFVSIGTGQPSLDAFGVSVQDVGKTLLALATETEQTAETFYREHRTLARDCKYFRFSVDRGLEHVGLEESSKASAIVSATRRYLESQAVFESVRAFKQRASQEESEDEDAVKRETEECLRALHEAGQAYVDKGWKIQAEDSLQRAYTGREKLLGPRHTDTLETMSLLAHHYWKQGQLHEAEKLERAILVAHEETLGTEHPETLEAVRALALTLSDQKRYGEEEKLAKRVLETRRKVLGELHPDTIEAQRELGFAFERQGKWGSWAEQGVRFYSGKFTNLWNSLDDGQSLDDL
ncbi:MAG: hypothetical protein M1817_003842 [Caeruleum heppii]|nr:MAG: hypothetical protein M1817_003842 [Caeruleum heppii]